MCRAAEREERTGCPDFVSDIASDRFVVRIEFVSREGSVDVYVATEPSDGGSSSRL